MRVAVTGGGGFVGGAVVRQLLARGDEVVALVRDPARRTWPERPGLTLVADDLRDHSSIAASLDGADALIHGAGSYRVGISVSERPAMYDANVGTAVRTLDAAIASRVPRIVYVSTVNVFGNTRGTVVDETYRRDPAAGFLSWYDETKWRAHVEVERRIEDGAPAVIVMPSQVYGPGDHTPIGDQLAQAYAGTLPFVGLGGVGLGFVHVEDLARGILAALDRGAVGRSYVLGGDTVRIRDALRIAARAGGHRLPRLEIPDLPLRIGAFLFPNRGAWFGLSPNLREIVSASIGVTYWATSARAATELGFAPRSLAVGLPTVLAETAGRTA
jgi:nucleoside-diphosphate-sugar epimerase